MRIGSTPVELALLASIAVIGAAAAVLWSGGPPVIAAATLQGADEPSRRVLVVVAAGSLVDEAVARPVAEAAGGDLVEVPATGPTSRQQRSLTSSRPDRVVVVGGRAALGDHVLDALAEQTDASVTRRAGADRYRTAAQVALTEFSGPVRRVLVMSGATAGRSGAATAAGAGDAPVLLVERNRVPGVTAAALRALRPARILIVGSPVQVSDATVEQLEVYAEGVRRTPP